MASKIAYLLGAGASYNALPLADKFAKKLNEFADELNEIKLSSLPSGLFDKDIDPLINAVKWLSDEGGKHSSIDTFAKKLYFKRDYPNLKKLKAIISTFLIIEQAKKNVDFRYDSFLATILEKKNGNIKLPEGLKIITWNYDTQLEKAFYGFCEDEENVVNEITLNKNIIRLNGHCGIDQSGHISDCFFTVMKKDHDLIYRNAIELYNNYMIVSSHTKINFAWEEDTRNGIASKDTSFENISSMVIIGYSFPYFNREVDELLLSSFPSGIKDKKIYLQLPDEDQNSVATRIKSLILPVVRDKVEIIPIKSTDHFHIPDEFWQ
jgi:hypothetical protein